jgi:23S rRNA (adenine2503-C2)-methyltransferase
MISVLELTLEQLSDALAAAGQPRYRAKQVSAWVFSRGVSEPETMTNLPPALRSELTVLDSTIAARAESSDGTLKLLVEYRDGERVECVMIPSGNRATACISTQAGCAMGCRFCASGAGGLRRQLTGGEILQQVLHLGQQADRKITNVVFMGMGEPLANYAATIFAVRALIDPQRFALSARHITVSTIGLPGQIRKLAAEDLPITLAISLHAPNDTLRTQIMPATKRWPLEKVLAAAEVFYQARRREITLEYVLLAGVNDTNVCAEGLAKIARRLRCNVNLIRYNPTGSGEFAPPSLNALRQFAQRLERRGINVNIRRSRGADADAACGQLRLRKQDGGPDVAQDQE